LSNAYVLQGKGLYVLFESASGYGLFEVAEMEEIGSQLEQVQASVTSLDRFSKIAKMKGFCPFTSAENALENINDISEGILNDTLKNFLELELPKVKAGKKAKFSLGVTEPKIGQAIQEALSFPCQSNETVLEVLRGIRMHLSHFVKQLASGNLEKAQLGLGHSYSRCKVKFNVNRSDNMIIQAICLLDQLDKDLNTLAMRVREWYGWHFPELVQIVKDNVQYTRCAKAIGSRASITDETVTVLEEILQDEAMAQAVIAASRTSMGMDVGEVDMINIDHFAERLISLAKFRQDLYDYLVSRMSQVAPNLAALIGEVVGARLISHAGSLVNLAKAPASTVQILGAEKALFRALKTKGNTPKYGLIFHSTFIGRAAAKNKGRISRYLANKCSIASRIDSFSDEPTSKYGEKLAQQVEERLAFYDSGEAPRKNVDVMREVAQELKAAAGEAAGEAPASGKKKRKAAEAVDTPAKSAKKKKKDKTQAATPVAAAPTSEKKAKKAKSEKKAKKGKK
jgi:nucleolar protein 56